MILGALVFFYFLLLIVTFSTIFAFFSFFNGIFILFLISRKKFNSTFCSRAKKLIEPTKVRVNELRLIEHKDRAETVDGHQKTHDEAFYTEVSATLKSNSVIRPWETSEIALTIS